MFRQLIDASSLEKTQGFWRYIRHRGYGLFNRLTERTESLWLSRGYFPLLLGVLILALTIDRQVLGAAVLLGTAVWFLALCPDLLAAVCPSVLAVFLVGPEYEDLTVFLPCLPLIFLWGAALIWHLIVWPVTICLGGSCRGLALVSIATVLGGCDVLPLSARTTPLTLYYTLGLGVGMLVFYSVFRSTLRSPRKYNVQERFALLWLTAGLGMTAVVAALCIRNWEAFAALAGGIPKFKCRNFCATILLTTLPSALYLSTRSRRYLLPGAVILLGMLFTGSRSALMFGAVLAVLGCVYLVRFRVVSRGTMAILTAAAAVFMMTFGVKLLGILYQSRIIEGHLITGHENRFPLLAQSLTDFLNHPAFGVGLGNTANHELFTGVPGSIFFYHNMLAQIAGSMGILGLAAYGRLIGDRIVLLRRGKGNPFVAMMSMSYLGMLLVSMTNPGEFCPFPNEAMMVMLFAMVEDAVGDVAVPVAQMLPGRNIQSSADSVYTSR